jgi:GTPase
VIDFETEQAPKQAVLASVQLPGVDDDEHEHSLAELGRLAKTLGLTVVGQISQRRDHFDPGAYVGSGKREELKRMVESGQANLILIDHEVSPSQARNLEKETGADVLDRTAVILEIFHRHARSRAAKAQVEIVRLKYMAPRMREGSKGGDRQQGGIGGKGAGESKMELDRRKIRDRIAELTDELEALEQERKTQRNRRAQSARAALVGYTNAGKSTLMRALTGSEVYVADKLFATLDTTVRVLVPESKPRILVSDTVGFIKKLPHGLVASFKSTLDEALEASVLLHVVDVSDAAWEPQFQVTKDVLAEIGAGEIPRIIVFNKVDLLPDPESVAHGLKERFPDCVIMSARRPDDVARLRDRLVDFFARDLEEGEILVPWNKQELRGEIFAQAEVLAEEADSDGARFRLRAPAALWAHLRERL